MKNKAAQALGRLARGVPKKFSTAERARRRQRMIALNQQRRTTKQNGAAPQHRPATQ